MPGESQHAFVPKKMKISVWGMDASGRAFTDSFQAVQLAERAVEIESARPFKPGEIVGVGLKGLKSRFRVISSRLFVKDTYRILLEDIGAGCMWREEMASPDEVVDTKQERRRHPRFPARGSVLVHNHDRSTSSQARLVDISEGGCYIETLAPSAAGSVLDLTIKSEGLIIDAEGRVCTSHPSIGMGIELKGFANEDDAERFRELLAHAEAQSSV